MLAQYIKMCVHVPLPTVQHPPGRFPGWGSVPQDLSRRSPAPQCVWGHKGAGGHVRHPAGAGLGREPGWGSAASPAAPLRPGDTAAGKHRRVCPARSFPSCLCTTDTCSLLLVGSSSEPPGLKASSVKSSLRDTAISSTLTINMSLVVSAWETAMAFLVTRGFKLCSVHFEWEGNYCYKKKKGGGGELHQEKN